MRREILGIATALALSGGWAHAASFNCSQASTEIEKQICRDSRLSQLDEDLASAYKRVLSLSPAPEDTKDGQRRWVRDHRNQCKTVECLTRAYDSRTRQLISLGSMLPFKPDLSRPSVFLAALPRSGLAATASKPLQASSAELIGRIEFGHDAAGGRWDFTSGTRNLPLRYMWQITDADNKALHRIAESGAFVLVRGRLVTLGGGERQFDDKEPVSIHEAKF